MRNRILNNWRFKLSAIIISTLLWLFIYAEHQPRFRTDYPVNIEYTNLPISYRLLDRQDVIRVRLQGEPASLNNLSDDSLKAVVDLAGLEEGSHRVQVKIINNTTARLVRRNHTITVGLENLNSIEMPVKLGFYGTLPLGMRLGQVNYNPEKVVIYGQTEDLARVQRVVANIELTDRQNTFRESVELTAVDEDGVPLEDVVKMDPPKIVAVVPVEKEFVKVVPITPRFTKGSGKSGFSEADFYPTVVSLVGNEEALRRIKTIETEEFDLSRCEEGGVFPLRLDTPRNVFANVERVTLSCASDRETTLSFLVNIKVLNLCDKCTYQIEPRKIKVNITGPDNEVNQIKISQISAVVDALGLSGGKHHPEVHVGLTPGVENADISYLQDTVTLTISKKED